MKAVVRSKLGSANVERLDDPAPPPDGIVVSPDGCGIYAIVPGHEFAGEGWRRRTQPSFSPFRV